MAKQQSQHGLIILTKTPLTEIVYQQRKVTVYPLTEQELDTLSETGGASSVYLGFTTFCFAVFLSFLVTILTVSLDDAIRFAIFVAVDVVTGFLSLLFGIMWFRSIRKASQVKRRIKEA